MYILENDNPKVTKTGLQADKSDSDHGPGQNMHRSSAETGIQGGVGTRDKETNDWTFYREREREREREVTG